jgi:hypothetical protein
MNGTKVDPSALFVTLPTSLALLFVNCRYKSDHPTDTTLLEVCFMCVRFQVLTATGMNMAAFWDVSQTLTDVSEENTAATSP